MNLQACISGRLAERQQASGACEDKIMIVMEVAGRRRGPIQVLVDFFHESRRRRDVRRAVADLDRLDKHLLCDLGLTRESIREAVETGFR